MEQSKIDPLHRVLIHNGTQFKTGDGVYYVRPIKGQDTIRRTIPKTRGKSARRADKRARRSYGR